MLPNVSHLNWIVYCFAAPKHYYLGACSPRTASPTACYRGSLRSVLRTACGSLSPACACVFVKSVYLYVAFGAPLVYLHDVKSSCLTAWAFFVSVLKLPFERKRRGGLPEGQVRSRDAIYRGLRSTERSEPRSRRGGRALPLPHRRRGSRGSADMRPKNRYKVMGYDLT